jgi:hypothetical protein
MTEELQGNPPSKINIRDEDELRWWAKELGVTEDKLRGAVSHVGDSADAVRKFLEESANQRQEMSE